MVHEIYISLYIWKHECMSMWKPEYLQTCTHVYIEVCLRVYMFTYIFSFCASVIIEEILVEKLRYYAVLI